ncbi:MAG: phospho-sugar mutase [Candidatus Moraniibacteriota bacterium]|nr:MAG: phospho-sugar mutase [Candidatus Moranbacteria bacterium]
MDIASLIIKAKEGFVAIKVGDSYKDAAIANLEKWLSNPEFEHYQPQIEHMIQSNYWDYLLDCFYQVIPFGTGGRRGEVGIGPNRINPWTIQASAQGHSQYLIKQYGDDAKKRGIVLAYDVRQFFSNKYFNDNLENPVRNLNCKDLALAAASVYTANGIKVFLFDNFRTTPELSFAIRYLKAVSGDMFSASHNPPEHNGKKIYDEYGGQLIAPFDEQLVDEVTQNVSKILTTSLDLATKSGLLEQIGQDVDNAYIKACTELSLSDNRNVSIAYTPLHGCGSTSVLKVLNALGFTVSLDPKTANPSGKFENITFNIPNPEVIQSFETPLEHARDINADIILNSDPDADRIGIMIKDNNKYEFLNGNEIGIVLAQYVIDKKKDKLAGQGVIVKTQVTSGLIAKIAEQNNIKCIGDLLVGFKFIGEVMNQLEKEGKIDNFLFGAEESHGFLAGNYVRDKDAVLPAIWLSELAAELKDQKLTIIDYLRGIYSKYGYFRNYLTEIRLPGAEGMSQIKIIQDTLKNNPPHQVGRFILDHVEDWMDRKPILSDTDKAAKSGMVFYFKPVEGTSSMRVTVRPSGTEPKSKMYFEIGSIPFEDSNYNQIKSHIEEVKTEFERAFMKACYKTLNIDFPDRGFLLFWQLPLQDKLKYFEVETEIIKLKDVIDVSARSQKLTELLSFLGSDPIKKVDEAFKAEYQSGLLEYLNL